MAPTKILFGQIVVVLVLVVGAIRGAAVWAAAELGYQARLGAPWFEIGVFVY